MLVTALKNRKLDLDKKLKHFAFGYDPQSATLPLTLEKKYVVAGIQNNQYGVFYLIIPDDAEDSAQPWRYPANLFKVIDGYRPKEWVETQDVDGYKIIGPKEMTSDNGPAFLDSLEDGEKREHGIFMSYYEKYAKHHDIWYVDGKKGI